MFFANKMRFVRVQISWFKKSFWGGMPMIVFVILCFEPEKLNPVIAAYVANIILELLTSSRMEVQYIGKGLHKTNTNCRTLIKKKRGSSFSPK